jgi:hypothetical protein
MGTESGLVFFISAVVILIMGVVLVAGKRVTRRYMVYRIVPLAGFFGAFGLAMLVGIPGGVPAQAGLACVQTFLVLLFLHITIGRRLRE